MRCNFKYLLLIFLFIEFSAPKSHGQEDKQEEPKAKKIEKEQDVLNFSNVKKLIKNDDLERELKERQIRAKRAKKKRVQKTQNLYNIPNEKIFWSFFTEYWLVKTAQELKWDFSKPDYGLEVTFGQLLETMGYYEKKFKILLLNTPSITHFSLPSNKDEYIFILSVPFMRTMDLTKLEISLLLLESFFRSELDFMKKSVSFPELNKMIGSNFYKKKLNKEILKKLEDNYTSFVYDKGFNFNQQFEVTKKMGRVLKSNLQLWASYLKLLKKVDDLIKTNILYKNYTKIYPSPEIQIKWLTSSKQEQ